MKRHLIVLGFVLMPFSIAARADSTWVTLADLTDAIQARRTFTAQQRTDLDLNGDGAVNAADLDCFSTNCRSVVPRANFASGGLTADEANGTVHAIVNFSSAAHHGTLNYVVSGTAVAGARYQPLSGNVTVTGATASIPIALIDDSVAGQQLQTVTIGLARGDGYAVGALNQFTLSVVDNDGVWHGMLESAGGPVQFRLSVVRDPAGVSASIENDGNGTYPAGTYPSTTASFTATSFEARFAPVTVPRSETALDVPFTRTLHLKASGGTGRQIVSPDLIRGAFEETLTATNAADQFLFRRPVTGTFTLTKQATAPNTVEPTLSAVVPPVAGGIQ